MNAGLTMNQAAERDAGLAARSGSVYPAAILSVLALIACAMAWLILARNFAHEGLHIALAAVLAAMMVVGARAVLIRAQSRFGGIAALRGRETVVAAIGCMIFAAFMVA